MRVAGSIFSNFLRGLKALVKKGRFAILVLNLANRSPTQRKGVFKQSGVPRYRTAIRHRQTPSCLVVRRATLRLFKYCSKILARIRERAVRGQSLLEKKQRLLHGYKSCNANSSNLDSLKEMFAVMKSLCEKETKRARIEGEVNSKKRQRTKTKQGHVAFLFL